MPLSLTTEQKDEIFILIKKAFSDFRYFDDLVADPLKRFIDDSTRVDIDFQITKFIAEKYISNIGQYQSKEQKEVLDKIRIILTAAAIHLVYLSKPSHIQLLETTDELLQDYPEFMDSNNPAMCIRQDDPLDDHELEYLLKFRNYMIIAIKLIPAKGNKLFLLRVMERLEGSNNEYITGTGQKPCVNRRVRIFHKESEVTIVKKAAKRKKEVSVDSTVTPDTLTEEVIKKTKTTKSVSPPTIVPIVFQKIPAIPVANTAITTTAAASVAVAPVTKALAVPIIPPGKLALGATKSASLNTEINFARLFSDTDKEHNFPPQQYEDNLEDTALLGDSYTGGLTEVLLGGTYAGSLTEELFGKNPSN